MNGPVVPNHTWNPPEWVKLTAWIIKDLGLQTVLVLCFVGVMLGWVNSPLMAIPPLVKVLEAHEKEEQGFRDDLKKALREQKCLTALPQEVRPQAALSRDVCDWMTDWVNRRAEVESLAPRRIPDRSFGDSGAPPPRRPYPTTGFPTK